MGRQANPDPRPFTSGRTKDGRTVWQAGIRWAYNKRLFLGTYTTKEDAEAAGAHYLTTGNKPDPGTLSATRRGPRSGVKYPKMAGRKGYVVHNPKPPGPPKPPRPPRAPRLHKPIKARPAPSTAPARPQASLDHHARGELLRKIYRAIY